MIASLYQTCNTVWKYFTYELEGKRKAGMDLTLDCKKKELDCLRICGGKSKQYSSEMYDSYISENKTDVYIFA